MNAHERKMIVDTLEGKVIHLGPWPPPAIDDHVIEGASSGPNGPCVVRCSCGWKGNVPEPSGYSNIDHVWYQHVLNEDSKRFDSVV